jgi:hypothetical protein
MSARSTACPPSARAKGVTACSSRSAGAHAAASTCVGARAAASTCVGALLLVCTAGGAAGQGGSPYRVNSAVVPQTITVGDVFQAAVRIELPSGTAVAFADSLALPANVETAGRRVIQVDTTAEGRIAFTAAYPLTAWRPGDVTLPVTRLVVRSPPGDRPQQQTTQRDDTISVTFPAFDIESVLPGDTTGIEPKPAKDVLGANRVWWPFLVAGALLLALLFALYVWRKRRRPVMVVAPAAVVPPRDRALAALEAARASGMVERGELKGFYTTVTDAVRAYVQALDGRWGRELTTSELAGRMSGTGIGADALSLIGLLGSADLVKFARRQPPPTEAYAEWGAARRFVESFDWPPPPAAPPVAEEQAA